MKKVGFVGWRGMVGSILMRRMHEENDFERILPHYFSTSSAGKSYIDEKGLQWKLFDATSIPQLSDMDIIISCQGGDYTKYIYSLLRNSGWNGYWIDAASTKRMDDDSIIILDPVNRDKIDVAIDSGIKNFIGGNCSITLTLMGLYGLLREDMIEWLSVMTYQAASGAGASYVRELLAQMHHISKDIRKEILDPTVPILRLMEKIGDSINQEGFPCTEFGVPLAGSIIPWIDSDLGNGMSREEWKGQVETNKILGLPPGTIGVDGLCIRVGAFQCHSTAVTMKLKEEVSIDRLESLIKDAHEWVDFVPNNKQETLHRLSPNAVSGSLKISIGRLRKLEVGHNLYSVLTIGDQLLWGAAEPLRRMLSILLDR